jgi:hypothetical protein
MLSRDGASGDRESAIDIASYLCGSPEQLAAYLGWMRIRARDFVRGPAQWPGITALAHTLLERRTLSQRDARRIVQEGREAAFQTASRYASGPRSLT